MGIVNYKSIVKNLKEHYSDATEVVVINSNAKILHSTANWKVSKDIKEVLASWGRGNAKFVNMNHIRYSVLQMQPERFIATNRQKKGHLVGSSYQELMCILSHISSIKQKLDAYSVPSYSEGSRNDEERIKLTI